MSTRNVLRSTLSFLASLLLLACAACEAPTSYATVERRRAAAPTVNEGAASTPTGSDGSTNAGSNAQAGGAPAGGTSEGTGAAGGEGTSGGATLANAPFGFYPTGVDDAGKLLLDNAVEPHYRMSSDDDALRGPNADTIHRANGDWVSGTATSSWISGQASTVGDEGCVYTFSTHFVLSKVDLSTVSLTGEWACDDSCTMILNGSTVASRSAPAWAGFESFSIPAGSNLQLGTNDVQIVVTSSSRGPMGVQIANLVGTATTVAPNPGAANAPPTLAPNEVDPIWERSNEHFLAPFSPDPDLQYYAANTYPLYNEDNSRAASFTWTTDAWTGPSTSPFVEGTGPIPGYVADDTWFLTYDRVNDGVTGTAYWFRTNIDFGTIVNLSSVTLEDKYFPGSVAVNDGMVTFVNGVPQPMMPGCNVGGSLNYLSPALGFDPDTLDTYCDTETIFFTHGPGPGWSFVSPSIPLSSLHDGVNEIAVMFEERNGQGGLDHLALEIN